MTGRREQHAATCAISNCRRRAPATDPFCTHHRNLPKPKPTKAAPMFGIAPAEKDDIVPPAVGAGAKSKKFEVEETLCDRGIIRTVTCTMVFDLYHPATTPLVNGWCDHRSFNIEGGRFNLVEFRPGGASGWDMEAYFVGMQE